MSSRIALARASRDARDRTLSSASRRAAIVLAACLASALAVPYAAYADVRPDDEILSKTIAERGVSADACPDIRAKSALLVRNDGTTYFARNADEPMKIASITKIMTAVVALENAPLDVTVVVDAEAASVGESSAGLAEGDSMSLETALYALMIPSGNDAAIAIAKTVGAMLAGGDGSDPKQAFVNAMNAKAQTLGCVDTLYTNPHGLDGGAFGDEAHSTASDVITVVSYAMKNDTFRSIVDAGDTVVTVTSANGSTRELSLATTDELLGVYDGMCGVKTGTTDAAGCCFAGAVERETGSFYSVVLNSPESKARFDDTVELYDWAYGNLVEKHLINTQETIEYHGEDSPLAARVAHAEWVDCSIDTTVSDPDLSVESFAFEGPISQEVSYYDLQGDVKAGDIVGRLDFVQNGEIVAQTDLIAARDQAGPDFWQAIGVSIDRFVRSMQNQPLTSSSECFNMPDSIRDL